MKNISVCTLECQVLTVRDHDRTKDPEPTSDWSHGLIISPLPVLSAGQVDREKKDFEGF